MIEDAILKYLNKRPDEQLDVSRFFDTNENAMSIFLALQKDEFIFFEQDFSVAVGGYESNKKLVHKARITIKGKKYLKEQKKLIQRLDFWAIIISAIALLSSIFKDFIIPLIKDRNNTKQQIPAKTKDIEQDSTLKIHQMRIDSLMRANKVGDGDSLNLPNGK